MSWWKANNGLKQWIKHVNKTLFICFIFIYFKCDLSVQKCPNPFRGAKLHYHILFNHQRIQHLTFKGKKINKHFKKWTCIKYWLHMLHKQKKSYTVPSTGLLWSSPGVQLRVTLRSLGSVICIWVGGSGRSGKWGLTKKSRGEMPVKTRHLWF